MTTADQKLLESLVDLHLLPSLIPTPEQNAKAARAMDIERRAFFKRRAERDARWNTRRA